MKRRPGHRKRIRHYHDPGHVHELTFSCYHRWPLLTNDVWRGMLAESIDRAMQGHPYRLTAFVFMPEHVHLMIYPLPEAGTIDYYHNPVRRGFVKTAVDWKWSSARYYMFDPPQRHPGLPSVHSLPAEWLNQTD